MLTPASLVLLAGLALGIPQKPPAPPPTPATGQPPTGEQSKPPVEVEDMDLGVSLDRIQRGIAQPPVIRLQLDRPIFRTEVIGRWPTIEEMLGPDFARGPANYGAMTHQEFLNMVTPKDVMGSAAFSNTEALTVFGTSFALQWILQRALNRYRNARTERELEAAKREVDEALKELDRARRQAGLPPR
jgi:hypothetical protein